MTFEQIEIIAQERGVMPDNASLTENKCYEAMAYLYSRCRCGAVSAEQEKIRKKNIRAAYEREARRDRICDEEARRYRCVLRVASDIEKHGSEDAKRLIRIMDGRERIIDDEPDTNDDQEQLQQ